MIEDRSKTVLGANDPDNGVHTQQNALDQNKLGIVDPNGHSADPQTVMSGAEGEGDKFYITLTKEDQNKVLECLASGRFATPSDFISRSIGQSHQGLEAARQVNQKFRTGITSLCARLERYQQN